MKKLEQYKKYSKKVPTDTKAEKGIKSCEFAIDWINDPTRYLISKMDVVNSKNNDFSPKHLGIEITRNYILFHLERDPQMTRLTKGQESSLLIFIVLL